jgi:hypothetical protein
MFMTIFIKQNRTFAEYGKPYHLKASSHQVYLIKQCLTKNKYEDNSLLGYSVGLHRDYTALYPRRLTSPNAAVKTWNLTKPGKPHKFCNNHYNQLIFPHVTPSSTWRLDSPRKNLFLNHLDFIGMRHEYWNDFQNVCLLPPLSRQWLDEGSKHLRNVDLLPGDYTAQYLRRLPSSVSQFPLGIGSIHIAVAVHRCLKQNQYDHICPSNRLRRSSHPARMSETRALRISEPKTDDVTTSGQRNLHNEGFHAL